MQENPETEPLLEGTSIRNGPKWFSRFVYGWFA